MAEVLLARVVGIEGFEHHVVIKKIRDEQAGDRLFVKMFLDEARLAAQLHHHNIVHVHDIGQDNGEYFFAMEYVHGEDVRRLLAHLSDRGERLPLDHCVAIALSAAAALHYAHELKSPDRKPLGIVHCDVSPANIMVGYDGNVKVCDFGIAKVAHHTTETGMMKGKVAYMSPEQCVGAEVDRRSDIYCLGIVLYELVTVRRLFKGANDFLTMSQITHGRIPPPTGVRPDIPRELEAIILRALAPRPADRFQTADELSAALERFSTKEGYRTSPTALADYMRGRFGVRPEPWHVDEEEPELSIDFDGEETGVVSAPAEALENMAMPAGAVIAPHAPILRARKRETTGAPPVGTAATMPVRRTRAIRPWMLVVVAAVVAGAVAVTAIALTGSPAATRTVVDHAAAPAARPAAAMPAGTAVTAPAVPPPPAIDFIADAIEIAEPEPADPERRSTSERRKRTKDKRPPPKGVWDPNSLLPPKR